MGQVKVRAMRRSGARGGAAAGIVAAVPSPRARSPRAPRCVYHRAKPAVGLVVENSTVNALKQAASWPHPVASVRLIETHISWVFLTGDYAYKVKKPVDYGFLDFSTLERRRFYCEEEVRLNRRLAPQIYLDVVPIAGTAAAPRVAGSGEAFDYAVRMRQFDDAAGFDRLLAAGELGVEHMDAAAAVLAAFHDRAAVADEASGQGSAAAVTAPVRENFDQIRPRLDAQLDDPGTRELFAELERWSRAGCERHGAAFGRRLSGGFVRECHGDLHLRNIVVWRGEVIPFDCIEFSDALRWIDTCSELAFLLMDLDDHDRRDLARRLLDAYLQRSGDYGGLELLDFYRAYRAMVRAKVASLRLAQLGNDDPELAAEMSRYLELARRYSRPRRSALLVTHGVSGSGKTFVSQRLLEGRDLIRLRSDVERKRLAGLAATDSSGSGQGTGLYAADMTARTYRRLLELAEALTGWGFAVIVDAAFLAGAQRDLFRRFADARGLPFAIVHCAADDHVQRRRVRARSAGGKDASEADVAILDRQLRTAEPLRPAELARTIAVDTTAEPNVAEVLAFLDAAECA